MRLWVGLALFFGILVGSVFAQAEGEVESIGLNGYYRPECWVPMVVRLRPTGSAPAEVDIRVIQEDLDRDRVTATRTVTVTPDLSGRGNQQRFWMYFRPQPTDRGLADAAIGGDPKKLASQLKVVLADHASGKVIANLPLTDTPKRVDVFAGSRVEDYRPVKVVLCVVDGASQPAYGEYRNSEGIAEPPLFVLVRPEALPEDMRGYEMVDAVLWLGANAPDPRRSLDQPRYHALEEWVRQGGSLVVCQGPESGKLRGFESILPVDIKENKESASLSPLPEMAGLLAEDDQPTPRRYAIATPRANAVTIRERVVDSVATPFLVRWPVGSGAVTWVAMDLGEPSLVRTLRKGWIRIWDEVFGWRNSPSPIPANVSANADVRPFSSTDMPVDVSRSFERGGELGLTASGYVLMAILFFAVYWIAAGPGLYAYLSLRKLPTLNWYLFGTVAIGAALLAMVVVRVVQSRPSKIEHVTLVRVPASGYSTMQSRVGLYIPSGGMKDLQMANQAAGTTNWITPYPEHPVRLLNNASQFMSMQQYDLPITDAANDQPARVSIPWRSTMKRLQLRWNGDFTTRVTGSVRLSGAAFPDISGTLTNSTPWELADVHLAYRVRTDGDGTNAGGDRILYIPKWKQGETIDLDLLLRSDKIRLIGNDAQAGESVPGFGNPVWGGVETMHRGWGTEVPLREGWVGFWYQSPLTNSQDRTLGAGDDSSSGYLTSLPLCSLFERIPPMRNGRADNGKFRESRRDIARVASRYLDVSPSLAAGDLVILAHARGNLPVPLTIDGDAPKGEGVILYQGLLPLSRGKPAATTQPSAVGNVEKDR